MESVSHKQNQHRQHCVKIFQWNIEDFFTECVLIHKLLGQQLIFLYFINLLFISLCSWKLPILNISLWSRSWRKVLRVGSYCLIQTKEGVSEAVSTAGRVLVFIFTVFFYCSLGFSSMSKRKPWRTLDESANCMWTDLVTQNSWVEIWGSAWGEAGVKVF